MDWEVVAYALAVVLFAVIGAVLGWASMILARVVDGLADVARVVHGHGIRLDYLEGQADEK